MWTLQTLWNVGVYSMKNAAVKKNEAIAIYRVRITYPRAKTLEPASSPTLGAIYRARDSMDKLGGGAA
jgi:hypothetical protein